MVIESFISCQVVKGKVGVWHWRPSLRRSFMFWMFKICAPIQGKFPDPHFGSSSSIAVCRDYFTDFLFFHRCFVVLLFTVCPEPVMMAVETPDTVWLYAWNQSWWWLRPLTMFRLNIWAPSCRFRDSGSRFWIEEKLHFRTFLYASSGLFLMND